MSSLVGQSLDGRYLLRRVISSGSKAVIFEGQHTVTNRLVVVKILSEDRFDDPKARHALLEEARMLTVVDHPCILRVVDAGTAELDDDVATAFLATELVEGRTMEGTVAARGALELSEGLQLGLTLLRAIDWMHRLGLVHGALNPRHVIVPGLHPADRGWDLRAPDARLLGFGAAARAAVEQARETPIADAAYLAPEQLVGEIPTPESDLFALGVMIYEALAGELPHGRDVRPAHEVNPAIPEPLSVALMRALERDPKKRPAHARELAEALLASKRKLPPPKVSPKKRRHHLRAPYITPVQLRRGDRVIDGRCEDISMAGMLVVSAVPFPREAKVTLRFALPGTSRFVDEPAEVRWSRGSKTGACAVGLSFDKLDPISVSALERYLEVYGTAPVAS